MKCNGLDGLSYVPLNGKLSTKMKHENVVLTTATTD
jgi:hypothetical protein